MLGAGVKAAMKICPLICVCMLFVWQSCASSITLRETRFVPETVTGNYYGPRDFMPVTLILHEDSTYQMQVLGKTNEKRRFQVKRDSLILDDGPGLIFAKFRNRIFLVDPANEKAYVDIIMNRRSYEHNRGGIAVFELR